MMMRIWSPYRVSTRHLNHQKTIDIVLVNDSVQETKDNVQTLETMFNKEVFNMDILNMVTMVFQVIVREYFIACSVHNV